MEWTVTNQINFPGTSRTRYFYEYNNLRREEVKEYLVLVRSRLQISPHASPRPIAYPVQQLLLPTLERFLTLTHVGLLLSVGRGLFLPPFSLSKPLVAAAVVRQVHWGQTACVLRVQVHLPAEQKLCSFFRDRLKLGEGGTRYSRRETGNHLRHDDWKAMTHYS